MGDGLNELYYMCYYNNNDTDNDNDNDSDNDDNDSDNNNYYSNNK